MSFTITVVDNITTLGITETPVIISEQVAGIAGAKGDKGDVGTAATIAAGTTTTGAAGTNASVTNVGTSSAATFNFTIPRGNTGNTGPTGQGYTAQGVYAAGTTYAAYDVVFYLGQAYRCKATTTGNNPFNTTYWELFAQGFGNPTTWSSSGDYSLGEVVTYNGTSYWCKLANTNKNPEVNSTYWAVLAAKGETGNTGPTGPTGSVAPTFWYSPTSNYQTPTLTASGFVDPFGLNDGVGVSGSKTYYVNYLLSGSIASTGSTSGSLRVYIDGTAGMNVNFLTHMSGALSSTPNFNWTSASDYGGYVNATATNFQVGGTLASAGTAQVFQFTMSGILRTSTAGTFQPKIALSAVSGTKITINRESFASLQEIGTSSADRYPATGAWS